MKPLLILVTGTPLPETVRRRGGFGALIRQQAGAAYPGPWREHSLPLEADLPHPTDFAAVVVTGSAARLGDREPWMIRGLEWLREAVERRVPVLGLCFGHQMLGEALGGRVAANPRGREMGSVWIEPCGQGPHALLGAQPLLANMTHLDSVVELPPGAQLLAQSALDPSAVVRFGERALGVQFHPEIDGEVMRDYIKARRGALSAEGQDPARLLAEARDTPASAALIPRFIRSWVLR